jgi:hypothetical protein
VSVQHLEERLRVLDLQLDTPGDHPTDERVALIATGVEPTAAEAAHLAGCDDCVELMLALGEGLEGMADELPELAALVAERPAPAARRAGIGLVAAALVFSAAALAAVTWTLRHEAPAVSVVAPVTPRTTAPMQRAQPAPLLPEPASSPEPPSPEPPPPEPSAPEWPALIDPAAAAAPIAWFGDLLRVAAAAPAARAPTRVRRPKPVLERPTLTPHAVRKPINGPARGFGWLRLNARPAARVYVDDVARGWTPLFDLRLAEGPHDVRLVYESPLARLPEERFRVLVQPEQIWRAVRDNRAPPSP